MIRASTMTVALVSGGGADGYVDRVVSLCLERVVTSGVAPVAAQPEDPGLRGFDMAELIAWACAAAGVPGVLPGRSTRLLDTCRTRRTLLPVQVATQLKGALLFTADGGSVGLSLGLRKRVIVHGPGAGVVVVDAGTRSWAAGARIPGARGYR